MFGSITAKEVSHDWDFPVHKDAVYTVNPQTLSFDAIEGKACVKRSDTGKVLSVVSENYQILPNVDVVDRTTNALKDLGLQYKADFMSINDDCKFHARFEIMNPEFTFMPDGHKITSFIDVLNSYDKSSSVIVSDGYRRMVCRNGMLGMVTSDRKSIVHYGEGEMVFDVMAGIQETIESIHASIQFFQELASSPIKDVHATIDFFKEKEIIKGRSGDAFLELLATPDNHVGRSNETLFDFYNCFTEMLTHNSEAGVLRKTSRLEKFTDTLIEYRQAA